MADASIAIADDADKQVIHVSKGEGRAFSGPGDRYVSLVTGRGSTGACFIVNCLVPPGGGTPPDVLGLGDAFFPLTEGERSVTVGEQPFEARTGDLMRARRGVPHTDRNVGTIDTSMLAIATPAGMAGWVEDAVDPAVDRVGLAQPSTPDPIARVLAAGSKYGVAWA